jgi:hypothetical protein
MRLPNSLLIIEKPDSHSRRLLRNRCALDAAIGGAIGDYQKSTGR